MNQRLLIGWAAGASVIAISALSYIAGKHSGAAPEVGRAASATERPYAGTAQGAPATQPIYAVPASLAGAPTQWRGSVDDSAESYVALFDPERREIVVERCRHPGYGQDVSLEEVEFCTPLIFATIAQLTEKKVSARDQNGSPVEVDIDAQLERDAPTLRLRFGGHDARLVVGSKNDLYQAMEAQPSIAKQKREYLTAMMSRGAPRESPDTEGTP